MLLHSPTLRAPCPRGRRQAETRCVPWKLGGAQRRRAERSLEARAFQTALHAGNRVKDVAHTIFVQMIVKSQDGGPRIDTHHIGTDPVTISIDVTEAITTQKRPALFMDGAMDVVPYQIRP